LLDDVAAAAERYARTGEERDRARERRLSHTWELMVSPHAPAGASVVAIRDYGDFPPQRVK